MAPLKLKLFSIDFLSSFLPWTKAWVSDVFSVMPSGADENFETGYVFSFTSLVSHLLLISCSTFSCLNYQILHNCLRSSPHSPPRLPCIWKCKSLLLSKLLSPFLVTIIDFSYSLSCLIPWSHLLTAINYFWMQFQRIHLYYFFSSDFFFILLLHDLICCRILHLRIRVGSVVDSMSHLCEFMSDF